MLKVHLRRMLVAAIIGVLLGWFWAYRSPKLYEAGVQIVAGSPAVSIDNNMPLEVRKVLLPGVMNDLDSDTGILKSEKIFKDALQKTAKELNREEIATGLYFNKLFPLFDLDIPTSLNAYAPDATRVVRVRVKAYTPEETAAIANNAAFSFDEFRKKRARDAVQSALEIVQTGAKNAKKELDEIDRKYRDLKVSNKIADIKGSSEALTGTVEAVRQKRNNALAELAGAQAEYASLSQTLSATAKFADGGSVSNPDPLVEGIRTLVVQAKNELSTLQLTYEDSSPFVINQKAKIKQLEDQLNSSLKTTKNIPGSSQKVVNPIYTDLQAKTAASRAKIQSMQSMIEPLNRQILEIEGRIAKFPGLETASYDFTRRRMVYEEEFQKNTKWATELLLAKEGKTNQIMGLADKDRIIDPVSPEIKKYLILSLVVGALLGLAYSFAVESFRMPVHTSWQLAELTALPVAASIPAMSKSLMRRHSKEINHAAFRPMESFRYMAFSHIANEHRPKVVLFTSVGEEVDSSLSAAELAVAIAKTGSRTILVDGDLRVPRLSELFQVAHRSGVAEILGRTMLPGEHTDLFVATEHDNLLILPAGASVTTGIADMQTGHLNALIEDLRDKSDTVILNCPPVDVFADASRLAQYVDEVALVISAKTTSYRAIPIAQEILTKSGAKSIKIVLTQASPTEEPFGIRTGTDLARR